MKTKRIFSLLLVIVLAAALLTGCSDMIAVTMNEDTSGSYEEVLTMSKSMWDMMLADLGDDEAIRQQMLVLYPTAEITLEDTTENDVVSKQIHMTMDFQNVEEFVQLMSGMGVSSVKFNKNYFSKSAVYSPETDMDTGLDMDDLSDLFGGDEQLSELLKQELKNMTTETKITFPYEVADTNGTVLEDRKTVIWTMEQMQNFQRLYATFGEQTSKTAPVITGAKNGKNYNTGISLDIQSEVLLDKVTVNTKTTESDALFLSEEGVYNITVLDKSGNSSKIKFRIDMTKPTVSGVKSGKTYKSTRVIKFSDKGSGISKATLNNKKISSGKKVTKKGSYTLVVTDKAGNSKTVKFKIK